MTTYVGEYFDKTIEVVQMETTCQIILLLNLPLCNYNLNMYFSR